MNQNDSNGLPDKWMTTDPASFAYFTVENRLPTIIERLALENPRYATTLARLESDIGSSGPVDPDLLSGSPWWLERSHEAKNTCWRDWPFFDLEFMFYAALITIFEGTDPFAEVKFGAALQALNTFAQLGDSIAEGISEAAWFSVFENENDLSQIEAVDHRRSRDRILINELPRDLPRAKKMAIVLDNVGWELLADLVLADRLLECASTLQLSLHCKRQAMFVSDTTKHDLEILLDAMKASHSEPVSNLSDRLRIAIRDGRLTVYDAGFWSEARHFNQIDADLGQELCACDLVICKGDLNYRRFVEDRKWKYTCDAALATQGVAFRGLALRTIKSEVLVGAPAGMGSQLANMSAMEFANGHMALAQRLGQNSTSTMPCETERAEE